MAEENQDQGEKTEQPTERRLLEARKRGQVARSRDFQNAFELTMAALFLMLLGERMVRGLGGLIRESTRRLATLGQGGSFADATSGFLHAVVAAMWPLLLLMFCVTLAGPILIGGFVVSAEAAAFKWERLDVVRGMQRLFGLRALMEPAKTLAKFMAVLLVVLAVGWWSLDVIWRLGMEPWGMAVHQAADLLKKSFLWMSLALVLIAAVDVPYQLWDHRKKLRMSRQELRDELKQTEGPPELRQRIRRMQIDRARQRMMQEVPKADVVVTNPTHVAVALCYDAERMDAPCVVAKGADLLAQQIMSLARMHDVVMVRSPRLARVLYRQVSLRQEIPIALFVAVAQVLAYVYALRRQGERQGELELEEGVMPALMDMDRMR